MVEEPRETPEPIYNRMPEYSGEYSGYGIKRFVRCEVLFGIKPRAYQELVRLCRCPSLWKTTR
jgi:hypothetical protein